MDHLNHHVVCREWSISNNFNLSSRFNVLVKFSVALDICIPQQSNVLLMSDSAIRILECAFFNCEGVVIRIADTKI